MGQMAMMVRPGLHLHCLCNSSDPGYTFVCQTGKTLVTPALCDIQLRPWLHLLCLCATDGYDQGVMLDGHLTPEYIDDGGLYNGNMDYYGRQG